MIRGRVFVHWLRRPRPALAGILHTEVVIATPGSTGQNGMGAVEAMAARHQAEMTAAPHPVTKMMRDAVGRMITATAVELLNHDMDATAIVMTSVVMTPVEGLIGTAITVNAAKTGLAMVAATTGRTTVASADHSRASVTEVTTEVASASASMIDVTTEVSRAVETAYGTEMTQCRRVIGTIAIDAVVLTMELPA